MSDQRIDDFDEDRAGNYDDRIRRVSPGYEAFHRCLTSLLRAHLEARAEILIVGAGTGYELVRLAEARPGWRFTAVDPSEEMLDRCRSRARAENVDDRVDYALGEMQSLELDSTYDASTSIFVSHFIATIEDRVEYFEAIADALRPGGWLVFADLFDTDAGETAPSLRDAWAASLRLTGMSDDEVEQAFERIETDITFLTPERLQKCIESAGFEPATRCFQALCWGGWQTRLPRQT